MIKNISNLGDAALYCDFGIEVDKETNAKVIKYFKNIKEKKIKGVTNISVPIFDYTNNAIAALTIPFVDRIIAKGELSLEQVKKLLVRSAGVLSSEMGYKH